MDSNAPIKPSHLQDPHVGLSVVRRRQHKFGHLVASVQARGELVRDHLRKFMGLAQRLVDLLDVGALAELDKVRDELVEFGNAVLGV